MDNETGLNNFELRMYDANLGRWLIPDPYHQYHSPYLGMGNNWISSVDPTGGIDDIELTSAGEYKVTPTSDPYDRFFFDGKYIGSTAKGDWGFALRQNSTGDYGFKAMGDNIYFDPPANTPTIDPWKGIDVHVDPNIETGYTLPFTGIHMGSNDLFWRMHEAGHVLQYSKLGIGRYMLEIAPMSGLNMLYDKVMGTDTHSNFYTETDANTRSFQHFEPFYSDDILNKFKKYYPPNGN